MDRLLNKVAIVTGSGQGIGEFIAKEFVREGAKVLLVGYTFSKLERVQKEICDEIADAQVHSVRCDITSGKDIQNMVEECVEKLGEPNVLINNAGREFFNLPLETSDEEWDKCLANDLSGAWYCAKAVLPYMVKNEDGAIVNISSVHGSKIIPKCFPYPVAKHGLLGLTKALGIEYGGKNIRVNSISPGLILTPLTRKLFQKLADEGQAESVEVLLEQQRNLLPSKRIGTSNEVAKLAVLLASDEARYINATDILIDGGRSALYHEWE